MPRLPSPITSGITHREGSHSGQWRSVSPLSDHARKKAWTTVPTPLPANSLLAEHGGKRTIAQAFAWYATARSTAGALGRALAGVLLTLTVSSYLWVFGVAFSASLVPVLVAAWFIPKSTHHIAKTEPKPQVKDELAAALGRPKIAPAMVFGFLVGSTAAMLRGLLPILAVDYAGLSEAETGLLYLVASVVVLTASSAFGWLADNASRNLVLGIPKQLLIFSLHTVELLKENYHDPTTKDTGNIRDRFLFVPAGPG